MHMVPNIGLLPLFFLANLSGRKIVTTFHETIDETKKRPFFERTILLLFGKYASAATCVSDFVQKSAKIVGFHPTTIYNGLEKSVFAREVDKSRIRKEFGIKNDAPIALYVGALRRGKGADVFVRLAKKHQAVNFIIVGKGALYGELEQGIKKSKNIFYKSHYGYSKLSIIYSSVDAVLFPSTIDAFGLVCLESISCGTPVIAFNLGGAAEILTRGTGVLCKDEAEMSAALGKVISKEFVFSREEQRLVQKKFDWNGIAKEYMRVYGSLVK